MTLKNNSDNKHKQTIQFNCGVLCYFSSTMCISEK